MKLRFHPSVQATVSGLAPGPKKELRRALRLVANDPRHDELDWKVLRTRGPRVFLRARVGSYRIIYTIQPDAVYVARVMHRREGYGWLERA